MTCWGVGTSRQKSNWLRIGFKKEKNVEEMEPVSGLFRGLMSLSD